MKTILSHANLIDCVEPKVRPDTAVLIEDGRIRAIMPSGISIAMPSRTLVTVHEKAVERVTAIGCGQKVMFN